MLLRELKQCDKLRVNRHGYVSDAEMGIAGKDEGVVDSRSVGKAMEVRWIWLWVVGYGYEVWV